MQNTTPGNGEISIVSGFPQMVPARNPILRRHIAYRRAAAAFAVVEKRKKRKQQEMRGAYPPRYIRSRILGIVHWLKKPR